MEGEQRILYSATISLSTSAGTAEPSIARNVVETVALAVVRPDRAERGRFTPGSLVLDW